MWFYPDWKTWAFSLIPPYLRGNTVQSWTNLFSDEISSIWYLWFEKRKENIYKLAHNSQKVYLRAALNDRFDTQLRRIRIDDGNAYKRKYIYTDEEQKPRFLGIIYIHGDEDYSDTGVDFIVEVPNDIIFNINEMKGLIDLYKLASKRYKIVIL